MRPGLSCYRVVLDAPQRRVMPWTRVGGDHEYIEPDRRIRPIIAARDELEARERAAFLGRGLMRGREVTILSIELIHSPGNHYGNR